MPAKVPANLDPARRAARVSLDAAPATVLPGGRRSAADLARAVLAAEATGVAASAPRWRASTRRSASSSAGRSGCSRRSSTTAPTWWSPPSWRRGRVGRGPGRARRRRPAQLHRGHRRGAGPAGRRSERQPEHPGARRDRVHLGARRAPVHAPGHGDRGDGRRREAAIEVTDLVRGGVRRARAIDLPPEAEPIRAAITPDVDRLRDLDAATPGAGADRDRLRDAALAEAVGTGRGRHRAARDRAGVRAPPGSSARPTASPAGSSSP